MYELNKLRDMTKDFTYSKELTPNSNVTSAMRSLRTKINFDITLEISIRNALLL